MSMAAANAVLDVIENENLKDHVKTVGSYLLNGLKELQQRHEIIGDIRGKGFFLGIDLVTNRKTREPDTVNADLILNM